MTRFLRFVGFPVAAAFLLSIVSGEAPQIDSIVIFVVASALLYPLIPLADVIFCNIRQKEYKP